MGLDVLDKSEHSKQEVTSHRSRDGEHKKVVPGHEGGWGEKEAASDSDTGEGTDKTSVSIKDAFYYIKLKNAHFMELLGV